MSQKKKTLWNAISEAWFHVFFVKAVVSSLQEFPAVNAEIRDDNIIYKNHFDIGIAVGTEKGLVVPVLKNADTMSFGDIEQNYCGA